ncbi:MAG: dihydroorotate dehydrogenase electron transfer subunit [Desulfosalsimonadaceae bacterium]|nr:dihydroorotate dehydrogenase electron transfer subunit [Desulfosalsimonadaceae bacterium]
MNQPAPKSLQLAEVKWNRQESNGYYRIGLTCSPAYAHAVPGQFVTIHLPGTLTPLLRRPFSIHRLIRESGQVIGLEILYKVVGGFTEKLIRTSPGDPIDLLGPIGHGFTVSGNFQKPAFVGGGIGVAPLVFLADALIDSGLDPSGAVVCLGGRTADDVLCADIFQSHGLHVETATDDGSLGEKGLVTRPLERWLTSKRPDIIYACGPMPMLRSVAEIARKNSLPCEVSIETVMACGLGACLGCAVNKDDITGKYQHVCIDGPVFDPSVTVF